MSQKWTRTPSWESIYGYIHEYQNLIYEFYSKDAIAFLTTYYHINKDETIWDDDQIYGGAYEHAGELQGYKRDKILLLPVYFIEEISTSFDGQDIGYIKENRSSIVIPSTYGFTPYPRDIIKLEQEFLRPTNDTYPLFEVGGVDISVNTDRRFWKLKIETFESRTEQDIENQILNTYVFFDYDKTIHTADDAEMLTKLLVKNNKLKKRVNELFDQNSGYYYV